MKGTFQLLDNSIINQIITVLDKLAMIEDRLVRIEAKVNKLENKRDLQEPSETDESHCTIPPTKRGRPESFPSVLKAATDIDFTVNDSQLETPANKKFLVKKSDLIWINLI